MFPNKIAAIIAGSVFLTATAGAVGYIATTQTQHSAPVVISAPPVTVSEPAPALASQLQRQASLSPPQSVMEQAPQIEAQQYAPPVQNVVIVAPTPPPPLPVYIVPPPPAPNLIWAPGHWRWSGYGYYWVPGTWVQPPMVGVLWTPGYWEWMHGSFGWHEGYWAPHVGFYGGINYGAGYVGTGFRGGSWNGNSYNVNRACNKCFDGDQCYECH